MINGVFDDFYKITHLSLIKNVVGIGMVVFHLNLYNQSNNED